MLLLLLDEVNYFAKVLTKISTRNPAVAYLMPRK